jgi:hypothetical protein
MDVRFEVFTAMKIQVVNSWAMTLCSDVQCEEEGSMVGLNVGIIPHHYMASQPRRP